MSSQQRASNEAPVTPDEQPPRPQVTGTLESVLVVPQLDEDGCNEVLLTAVLRCSMPWEEYEAAAARLQDHVLMPAAVSWLTDMLRNSNGDAVDALVREREYDHSERERLYGKLDAAVKALRGSTEPWALEATSILTGLTIDQAREVAQRMAEDDDGESP